MKENSIKIPDWVAWISATTIGFAIAMQLSTLVLGTARLLSPVLGGIVYVLLYGAVIGIFLGIAQFLTVPRGEVDLRDWVTALTLGAASGFTLAAVVAEILGNLFGPNVSATLAEATIEGVAGALVGLAIGYAQYRSLRTLPRGRGWLIASTIGGALGYAIALAILELFEFQILKANTALSFGAILGIFIGVSQGLALRAQKQ